MNGSADGLYLFHLSLHGLLRGTSPELGRDPDTGGQITYVLELVRALGRSPRVSRVDLVTRLVEDPAVGPDYAVPIEPLGESVRIVRLPFGPKRYLRKELLWPHLPALVDRCVEHLRAQERLPHLIHTHYADAGYVGVRLSQLLGIPLVHTGHSLGRTKRSRYLAAGRAEASLERPFRFSQRIPAEEEVLENARLVLASTRQEVDEQWGAYENFRPGRFAVVPPGVDTSRFSPPSPFRARTSFPEIDRWLREPHRPLVLAISLALPATARLMLIPLALMSGTVLVNLAPSNPYSMAALATWQQGHFLNFNGLTRWVATLWPFLTLPFLLLIVRRP